MPPEAGPRLLWWRALCVTSLGRLAVPEPILDGLSQLDEIDAALVGLTAVVPGYADSTFAAGYLRDLAHAAQPSPEVRQTGDYYCMLVVGLEQTRRCAPTASPAAACATTRQGAV
ncbi:MAG: hypothetical protein AMS25_12785 [Gemmatimonas sp. SM23_52]|nr:MAG: hypothetical protein AMS25_12785 [Gemmatimonas sp. SM23_52]